MEEASDEVEEIEDDSFQHSDLFQMDEAALLRLAHRKLPYFHSVRELKARGYEFRLDVPPISSVAFDKLFKVSKRTRTVEQQEPHPVKQVCCRIGLSIRKRTYRKRSRSSKRHRRN